MKKKTYLKQNILPAKMNNKLPGNWLLALKVTSLITHKIIRLNKAFREYPKIQPYCSCPEAETFYTKLWYACRKTGQHCFHIENYMVWSLEPASNGFSGNSSLWYFLYGLIFHLLVLPQKYTFSLLHIAKIVPDQCCQAAQRRWKRLNSDRNSTVNQFSK